MLKLRGEVDRIVDERPDFPYFANGPASLYQILKYGRKPIHSTGIKGILDYDVIEGETRNG
jgi:hypothetical protein